jgi:aminoglycoside phosphotransferase (APT) family kinase protein
MVALVDELNPQLETWSRTVHGAQARVANAGSLGGHSGVTVGFDVFVSDELVEQLVLKIPPAGVNRKNNFDVLRQVPLLQVLAAHQIPAPKACYWSEDESIFGAPYLMMSRLKGAPPADVFGSDAGRGMIDATRQFGEAITALVRLHAIDAGELVDWNVVRRPPEEIDHWVEVLHKSTDSEWIRKGMSVRDLLHRHSPANIPFGIVHGDFYTNNWIYDDVRLTGIVDWEGASLGPVLLDLGWVCMMYDKASWGPMRRSKMGWHPEPDFFIARYAKTSTNDLSDVSWYRALAGYRLACITAYYFERHRSGKRHNPAWDVLGESLPYMLDRATALLSKKMMNA